MGLQQEWGWRRLAEFANGVGVVKETSKFGEIAVNAVRSEAAKHILAPGVL